MNWGNITYGQFQQIEAINKLDLPDMDKVLHTACIVYNKTEYQIDNEKPVKVVKMISKMQSVFETPFNPKAVNRLGRYAINYDVSKITLGQYVSLSFYITKGPAENAHYILATMASVRLRKHSTKDHKRKADYFLKQPIELVVGALNEIQQSYNRFNQGYQSLFGVDPGVSGNVENDEFNKRYGWIYSATQVALHEGIPLDEAYGLPVIQAFNDLIFLKAKCKYEVEQFNKSNKRPV